MSAFFLPTFAGLYKPVTLSPRIFEALAARVREKKVFPGATARRNRYVIVEQSNQKLRFRATTLLTGSFLGLNDVTLRTDKVPGAVHYSVSYWTWAGYCIGLGLFIAAAILGSLLLFQIGGYSTNYPFHSWVLWCMLGFWCLIWPWILIAMHKLFVPRALIRTLEEANKG
jgi:hypothetical protein